MIVALFDSIYLWKVVRSIAYFFFPFLFLLTVVHDDFLMGFIVCYIV